MSSVSRRQVFAFTVGSAIALTTPRVVQADDPQATIEALQRELDQKEATVEALRTQVATLSPTGTPTPSPTPTPDPSTSEAVITEFGQEGTIRYLLDRWELNFDPVVEVRTFIGDYSIVPRRGQFLVMWFNQQAVPAEPLPLANFELLVLEPDSDKRIATYDFSLEGSYALALTELDWSPRTMQSQYVYRTGVVFDIKPEDVHFRLQFRSAGLEAGEQRTWIDIEFRA